MRRSPRRLRSYRVPLARPPAPRATTTAAPARRAGQPSSRRPPQPVRRWPRADWSCRSRRDPRTTTPKTAALWPREPPGQAQARRPDRQSTDAGAIPGPRRACHPEAVSRPWRPSQYSREPAPPTLRRAGLTRRGRTGAAPADDGTGIDRLPRVVPEASAYRRGATPALDETRKRRHLDGAMPRRRRPNAPPPPFFAPVYPACCRRRWRTPRPVTIPTAHAETATDP